MTVKNIVGTGVVACSRFVFTGVFHNACTQQLSDPDDTLRENLHFGSSEQALSLSECAQCLVQKRLVCLYTHNAVASAVCCDCYITLDGQENKSVNL